MSVWKGDVPSAPHAEKVRRFLALLAWQPNEFVADDFIIDRIWEDIPPVRPKDTLYTCASRLRQALGCGAGPELPDLISRRRGGYVFHVDPEAIDVHRFRRLVRSARDADRTADWSGAVDLFDSALALWRGAPMSDLGSSWAGRVRVTLERERLSAQIECAQLALSLGRHMETVPLLYQLAEDHPLDEKIAELLIQALYLSGRQAESLARFASIRNQLVLELGNEPGMALRHLHSQILRRDPTLTAATLRV
ncbi:BTAD domain-containing putative transcriptional regulator [Streptomyces sp. NPDC056244]|uniref:AfsR/SARP family transcriptional regulator n=1 Tax=unclassified Streptomyces TaxID=2593676 RepID=UPI0035D5646E